MSDSKHILRSFSNYGALLQDEDDLKFLGSAEYWASHNKGIDFPTKGKLSRPHRNLALAP
jgi:hypothetical protein